MKRLFVGLAFSAVIVGVLAGCATGAGIAEPMSPAPTLPMSEVKSPTVDAEAQAKARSWLDAAVLPADALPSESVPLTDVSFDLEAYEWWCRPMEELSAYWTLSGASVKDTAVWLSEHPAPGFIVPHMPSRVATEVTEIMSVGLIPSPDSLEGLVYTVAKSPDGVAIRARIGVIPDSAVCPSPEPGTRVGGPGQG